MAYRDEVLIDGPVLYYEFDETTGGGGVIDSAVGGTNGVYAGTPGQGLEIDWRKLTVDGTGGLRLNPTRNASNRDGNTSVSPVVAGWPTTDLSIEFWAEDPADLDCDIVSYASSGNASDFAVRLIAQFIYIVINGTQSFYTGRKHDVSALRHYVFTWASGTGDSELYVNGVLVDTVNLQSAHSIVGGGSFVVGRNQTGVGIPGTLEWTGAIDEVAIYPSVLSSARVLAHYNAGRGELAPEALEEPPLLDLDFFPPVIGTPSPAAPGPLSPADTLTIVVTEETLVLDTTLIADYGDEEEVIYRNSAYQLPYSGTDIKVGNATTYIFSRTGGWKSTPFTLDVRADDADNSAVATHVYTVSPDPEGVPLFALVSPVSLSIDNAGEDIVVSVTDTSGPVTTSISVDFEDRNEEIFRDGAFVDPYTGSAQTLGDTTTFSFQRGNGWNRAAFTVIVEMLDVTGNFLKETRVFTVDDSSFLYPPNMQPFLGGANP